jgi:hypothetical protein
LYTSHVVNATKVGGVDGIFADHASVKLNNKDYSICNGAGSQRTCFYFDKEFAEAFDVSEANSSSEVLSLRALLVCFGFASIPHHHRCVPIGPSLAISQPVMPLQRAL